MKQIRSKKGSATIKKHTNGTLEEIKQQFELLIKEHESLPRLAAALGAFPGFEKTSVSTVWRWANGKGNTEKAQKAIYLLRAEKGILRLRLGVPRTLQVLPLMILLWPDTEAA